MKIINFKILILWQSNQRIRAAATSKKKRKGGKYKVELNRMDYEGGNYGKEKSDQVKQNQESKEDKASPKKSDAYRRNSRERRK